MRLLRTTDITKGMIDWATLPYCTEAPEDLEKYRVWEGDIFISRAGSVGYSALVSQEPPEPTVFASYLIRFRPRDPEMGPFIRLYLESPQYWNAIGAGAAGIAIPNVNAKKLAALELPVPPRTEQDRIVGEIEAHEARIGDGEQSLTEARKLATALSQAIRDAAAARTDGTIRPLEDCLGEPLMNGRSVRTAEEGFPVLRLTALKHGRIDVSEAKVGAWTESEASPYVISAGDFLIARGNGSLNLVGRGGMVEDDPPPVAFPDTLIRVRVNPDALRPEFLRLVWDSRSIRAQIEAQARTTAGIYKINQGHVRAVQLPVPDLDEQDCIVNRAQSQVAALDELLTALDRQSKAMVQLRSSVLSQAFSGSLVAQDPADEPASELLRTIRGESEAANTQLELAG